MNHDSLCKNKEGIINNEGQMIPLPPPSQADKTLDSILFEKDIPLADPAFYFVKNKLFIKSSSTGNSPWKFAPMHFIPLK